MDRRWFRRLAMRLAFTGLVGCVPQQTAEIGLPEHLETVALFDCADATVRELHERDELWRLTVTLHDVVAGRFETGNFNEANAMGYRVRLVRRDAEPRATLSVRAPGPYFTDIGADHAISAFKTTLAACLAHSAAGH